MDCSILYNRAVYPEESFTKVKKYGLTMLLTQDEGVKNFIANLTSQLSGRFPPTHLRSISLSLLDCSRMCSGLSVIGFVSLKLNVAEWLEAGKLQRIVLVIMSKATSEVLERWNFNIVTDAEVVEKGCATVTLIPNLLPSSYDPNQSILAGAHCVSHGLIASSSNVRQGYQGEERQGDHEGDSSHHAPDRLLHHLPPLPRRAM